MSEPDLPGGLAARQAVALERELQTRLPFDMEEAFPLRFEPFLCGMVRLRDGGGAQFEPWLWQKELARALPLMKRAQFLKARQLGMSWMLAAYALHTALTQQGAEVLLTSQTQSDAAELLAKVRFILEHLPATLRRPPLGRCGTSLMQFRGIYSSVRALPSTERAGRGFTGRLVVADEHAFHRYALANMAAIDPAIEAQGQFLAVSSANGAGNLFADLWARSVQECPPVVPERRDGEWSFGGRLEEALGRISPSAWLPVFLPYGIRPGRTPEWWEERRRLSLPSWLIYQEYPRDAEEAFVQTGRPVFPAEALEHVRGAVLPPLPADRRPEPLRPAGAGMLRIWQPPRTGCRYAAGVDVAEGLEHGDYSDLSLICADGPAGPEEVLSLHGHLPPDELALWIDRIARLYPGVYGVERNGHGVAVLLALRRLGTPGVYQERPLLQAAQRVRRESRPGWVTTAVSKALMIDELEAALRHGTILFRDELLLTELARFQRQPGGGCGAPCGQFDDRVMSRAIAVQMLKQLPPRSQLDPDGEAVDLFAPRGDW